MGHRDRWDPPEAVAFSWHPGYSADRASRVEVTFASAGAGQTRVTLAHTGWEAFADPAAPRAGALTEDPRFGEHVAFLNRMREAGYLVLAAPLADTDGEA